MNPERTIARLVGVPTINLGKARREADSKGSEGVIGPFFAMQLYHSAVITVIQRGSPATVELASAIAETAAGFNRRVMMIDGDVAKPILHERFGHPQTPGLAEVLAGRESLRGVVRRASPTNRTAVLTAGSGETYLFGVDRVIGTHQLVAASGADCAVLSTTSNSSLDEALLVAHHFPDAVVLAVDPATTTQSDILNLAERVRSVGGRLAGIVLHDGGRMESRRLTSRDRRSERRRHLRKRLARDWSGR
jgi:hypothetical protein